MLYPISESLLCCVFVHVCVCLWGQGDIFLFFLFFSEKVLLCTEGKGSVLLGCRLPHGGQDIAQLLSLPLGTDVPPPPFSWWTWRPACPWRPWAAPWPAVHKRRSRTPPGSCPAQTWCAWWGARGGGCASACSHSWSPCGSCWGPQPWGSAEPWLLLFNGCCSSMAAAAEARYLFKWDV